MILPQLFILTAIDSFLRVYGILDKAFMDNCKQVFVWTYIFIPCWEMPRSDIVWSYGNCLKRLVVFSSGWKQL